MKLLFLGTWEIILIVLVVLLLFGGKKIPELMKGVGKGVKSFKDGMNGIEDAANTSNNNTSNNNTSKSPETKHDGSQPEV